MEIEGRVGVALWLFELVHGIGSDLLFGVLCLVRKELLEENSIFVLR